MPTPTKGREGVDAAVAALQERLADGDPTDPELRVHAEGVLNELRATYRKDPGAFTLEAIEALKEFSELLRDS